MQLTSGIETMHVPRIINSVPYTLSNLFLRISSRCVCGQFYVGQINLTFVALAQKRNRKA